jgi:hypothetical protein
LSCHLVLAPGCRFKYLILYTTLYLYITILCDKMAGNPQCYVCETRHRVQVCPKLSGPENALKREIATRHREEMGKAPREIQENTRVCHNCNKKIVSEINVRGQNDGTTMIKVIVQGARETCFICNDGRDVHRLNVDERMDVYMKIGVYLPNGTRSCPIHLNPDGIIPGLLLAQVRGVTRPYRFDSDELAPFLEAMRTRANHNLMYRFRNTDDLTEDEFKVLTPLSKLQFGNLYDMCPNVRLYGNERNVLKHDLLMFLCKLRQGLSDEFLRVMFSYPSRQDVSLTISKVRLSLLVRFVPENLGYGHITRDNFIAQHVSDFANQLYNHEPNIPRAIAYIDGTYAKIPKSANFQIMRQSYCVHKHHTLLKPALVVGPDGYILDVHGPYFSDSRNNDASMLQREFERDVNGLRAWFREGDIFVVDRGYRDAIPLLEALGISIEMPSSLAPQTTAVTN